MTTHRSLLRYTMSRKIGGLRPRASRNVSSRPDFLTQLESKTLPRQSSQSLNPMKAKSSMNERSGSAASLSALLSSPSPESPSNSSSRPDKTESTKRQSPFDVLNEMTRRMPARSPNALAADSIMSRADSTRRSKIIESMAYHNWRSGDVYAPHDLSPEEMKKYKKARPPKADVFDVLNIQPLDEYKNLPLMMDFVTDIGRLKSSKETGLRLVNQRKISKAVRRASALGLLPRTHAHPEMLRRPGPWQKK